MPPFSIKKVSRYNLPAKPIAKNPPAHRSLATQKSNRCLSQSIKAAYHATERASVPRWTERVVLSHPQNDS